MIVRADRARDLRRWVTAALRYRKALDRHPANPPIWVQYGHALKESGRHAEAESAYRTAIAYDPRSADAHLQLGHVLKIQGKSAEAEAAYLLGSALDPSLPEPGRELGGLGWSEAALSGLKRLGRSEAGPQNSELQDRAAAAGQPQTETDRLRQVLGDAERWAQWSEAAAAHMQAEIAALQEELRRKLQDTATFSTGTTARQHDAAS